jgi:hypothetical protein
LNPAKKYVAQYQPPKPASISADDLMWWKSDSSAHNSTSALSKK